MTLTQIAVFVLLSLPFMVLVPAHWRPWGLMLGSLAAVAWLMGEGAFSGLDFVLVAGVVLLVVLVWWLVRPASGDDSRELIREDRQALVLVGGVLALAWALTLVDGAMLPPAALLTGGVVTAVGTVSLTRIVTLRREDRASVIGLVVALIVLLLALLKVPPLADFLGFTLAWDAPALGAASPFVWLGFSYVAFRLIAVLLDYRAGRLKQAIPLRDMLTYALFFPAFTAGPIDRAQRFVPEVQAAHPLDAARLIEGGGRIAVGLFKKFVVADSLALLALSPVLLDESSSTVGAWVLLYLYALQIFFDFSGYSDIAIGLGRLYGITLPENFNRPYLQPNIQQFWQRWHITLSTWFRVYYFTPMSRYFITRERKLPQPVIILLMQTSTMLLIGLWHGVTVNFALWGLWHGLGLFAHKMLADNTKAWTKRVHSRTWSRRLMFAGSVFVTFHFVALGWVFFALPDPASSFDLLARLFGVG